MKRTPKQIEICASICPLVEATEKAVTFAEGCLQINYILVWVSSNAQKMLKVIHLVKLMLRLVVV